MTNALAWLNDLVQWLGRWIPRIVLIHPTHKGVRFGPKGGALAVGPGLVFYWPITHDLIQVPITTQSIQLNGQCLNIDSNATVPKVALCTLNVQFSITDAVKASTRVLHFPALIMNRAQSIAAVHWKGDTADKKWIAAAAEQLEQEMVKYGIQIHALDIAGIGIGVALKNISDWSYADSSNGKRPE
jgi:hypothetical protein